MSQQPEYLVIDVDTGIDDALALLYACAEPNGHLVGVSTVVGNVSLEAATRNTRAVLALAGRGDIPVWPGSATPLSNFAADARAVHGETGLGYAILPEPPQSALGAHAVDAIVGAAHAHAGRLILVATGPLTNIALAVMREPELPRLLKRFVIMGGAYREPGNVTPSAEFNIWHDPEAARIVFRAFGGPGATPVTAIGLDVTHKTTFDPSDLAALETRSAGHPLAPALTRFIRDASRHYFDRMEKRSGKPILRHARPAGARRRPRSDARRDPPGRRRRRDRRAAHDGRHDRRLARRLGPARQQRSRRLSRRRALPKDVLRRDGPACGGKALKRFYSANPPETMRRS